MGVAVSESTENRMSTENRVVLRIPAVLRGERRVAWCVLEIWREESSTGRRCTHCRIANDPPELPDGSYRVEFARYSVPTRKVHGTWEQLFVVPERAKAA